MASLKNSLKAMVRIFRGECHRVLESERTTIRGADDMLLALQLTMAEVNKQEEGEFCVALSDVLLCWKWLLHDRLQLPSDGSSRFDHYERVRQDYERFLKHTNTVDLIDVYLMVKRLRADSESEELLAPTDLLKFLLAVADNSEEKSPVLPYPTTPSSQPRPCTAQMRRVARRVFNSYLGLLVNSKNDLALAHVLDAPSRSLGHTAFTDIKHAAQNNQTSLFLAVTSFVRAIQLGGKGYAPSEADPLRKHLKGLSEFVHFTDQLEEILGETPEPSVAGIQLVARVRSVLLKGRSSGEPSYTAVDDEAKALKECIGLVYASPQQSALTTGISPARPKAYAINHATAYIGRDTVKVLLSFLDEEAVAPPCRNKAELLLEDHSMLSGTEGASLLNLYKSPEALTGSSPKPLHHRIQTNQAKLRVKERGLRSQFACTYKDIEPPLNRALDLDFPSTSQLPTCKHPAPKRLFKPPHAPLLSTWAEDTENKQNVASRKGSHQAGDLMSPVVIGHESDPVSMAALRNQDANTKTKPSEAQQQKKKSDLTSRKIAKRKQVPVEVECGDENQPPAKKPSTKASCTNQGAKKSVKPPKKMLLPGQGKLTTFFRL